MANDNAVGLDIGRNMAAVRHEDIAKENSAGKQHRGKARNKGVTKFTASRLTKEGKEVR